VRGPRGSEVVLTIERAGEADSLQLSIVRTRFEVPTIEAQMLRRKPVILPTFA
jgi:C-terminal processing protease CtpA/Prc